jgi:release factor glutamine methyltransferase
VQTVSGEALHQWYHQIQQEFLRHQAEQLDVDHALTAQIFQRELDIFLQQVAGLDRLSLRLQTYRSRPQICLQKSLTELTQLWGDRWRQRIPLQYLMGETTWRNFVLKVSPAVLIPRPETEELIDLAMQLVDPKNFTPPHHWADLGTGSAAIALGLASVFPTALIHAVDCSAAALVIAQWNIQNQGLTERIFTYHGEWLNPLDFLQGKLTGIVANPPYIPTGLLPHLQPEVTRHEPHLALDGGDDGLDSIQQIVCAAPRYLSQGGGLLLEIMSGQAESVKQLIQQQGSYANIQIHRDLSGGDRFVWANRI